MCQGRPFAWRKPRRFHVAEIYLLQCMNSLGWKKNLNLRLPAIVLVHLAGTLPPTFWNHRNSLPFV
jgi:hypothetical protein